MPDELKTACVQSCCEANLHDPLSRVLLQARVFSGLRPYKDLVCLSINNQPAVGDLRTVVLFMRRVRAHNNAGRIMRISRTGGIAPSLRRILFVSLCLGDRRSWGRPMFNL